MCIEHVTIFPSKYVSKSAVDMKCSPDVDNNPSNPYIQINSEIKLCNKMQWHRGKSIEL